MLGQEEGQRVAVEFTVIAADEVPAELQEILESHKTEEIAQKQQSINTI